ncbi:reverse transcriptase/maturase family protein [Halomonas sp. IOP_31]|uniref:reverse transcriptase/maturase family protein n=1 Tax=Halomonas sp. IOP_31 TaxID=2876584 RepID=UPI001E2D761E|nr:reverse transcriptase/maturase family protein [Halomonas sp. IOP_31]MCD6006912.1 reverse transcriptase/maturase family protein [Halomonas sp. IOP_31]
MAAYHAARKGKRYRPEVVRYTAHLEENLINLHNHLVWQSWRPSPPREFTVLEPKMRLIQAPPFEDRIVHHALVDLVEPMFERRFIHHSYACRKGKGTHAAILALQRMLRECRQRWESVYVVQADVRQFFASIEHEAAMSSVARVIDCPVTLALWRAILSGYGHEDGIGQPVGALTSQLTANIVLDGVDHEMTDGHGAGRYLRYMDDIIILEPTKALAWQRLEQLGESLARRGLTLNPKTQVRPASAGVDWCGYRTWSTHILPRKRNVRRFRTRLRQLQRRYAAGEIPLADVQQQVHCLLAYTKHCDAWRTTQSIINDVTLRRDHADH